MKTKGRRVAIATGFLALAVLAFGVVVSWRRILEEWYLYRLRSGDGEAKVAALEWIGMHGTERCVLPCEEASYAPFPELLLERAYGKGVIHQNLQPMASAWLDEKIRKEQEEGGLENRTAINKSAGMATKALVERLGVGKDRIRRIGLEILAGRVASARLKVYFARGYLLKYSEASLGPGLDQVARRCLLEALADRDFLVRAGACYGLAECGGDAREAIPAIEVLQQDPDEVVREAAGYALQKIRGKEP